MSKVYLNGATNSFTGLSAVLLPNTYTFSALDTNISDLSPMSSAVPVSVTSTVTDGVTTYTLTIPPFTDATAGTADAVVIYEDATGELMFYISTDTITAESVDITVSGVAVTITDNLTVSQWTRQIYDSTDSEEINPNGVDEAIALATNNYANTLMVCTFSRVASGKIRCIVPQPIVYTKTMDKVGATDVNPVHSKAVIGEADLSGYSCVVPFSIVASGKIFGADRLPRPSEGDAAYTFPINNLTPLLKILRSVDFTETNIDITNDIYRGATDGYAIQVQAADDQQGTFSRSITAAAYLAGLPLTDTVPNARFNYKYRARFRVYGTINGVTNYHNGSWGAPRYTVGKGKAIV